MLFSHCKQISSRLQWSIAQRFFSSNYGVPSEGNRKLKICVGMSGGVDSAVTALLLKQSGHEVIGVFMKNWEALEESGTQCPADKEAADAEKICDHIQIPFRQVNFVKEYWNEVFNPLLEDYQRGETPFPDVDCNRHIKFGHFHRYCVEDLGCDYVATGHYARINHLPDQSQLLQAVDRVKDQTLFLSQVPQSALRKTLFPMGDFTKDVVKKIASSAGLDWVAKKKESMGICFIGKRKDGFQNFMDEFVTPCQGDVVDIDTGQILGQHEGIHKFTLGQRYRIPGQDSKLYVVSKSLDDQVMTVCRGEDHPSLFSETFFTHPPHWISGKGPPRELQSNRHRLLECNYRSQNKMPLLACAVTLRMTTSTNWEYISLQNGLTVSLSKPQRALTVGQFAAFYVGEVCLGSAKIERVGPSLYTMNYNNCRTKILDNLNS